MEIERKGSFPDEELSSLADRLTLLESALGEEHDMLVQLKTFQYMTKETCETYNVDLQDLKDILR